MKLSLPLAEVDFADIAVWPRSVKVAAMAVLATFVLLMGYLLVHADSRQELAAEQRAQERLQAEAQSKAQRAQELAGAEARRQRAVAALRTMLRRLPTDTEVPALIEHITRAAVANGLTIDRIALGEERPTGLYLALPIAIAAHGKYHQFGAFAADIASLPRLVTLHDFEIKADSDRGALAMTITAETYRYTDHALELEDAP